MVSSPLEAAFPASLGSVDHCLPLTPFAPCMLPFATLSISPSSHPFWARVSPCMPPQLTSSPCHETHLQTFISGCHLVPDLCTQGFRSSFLTTAQFLSLLLPHQLTSPPSGLPTLHFSISLTPLCASFLPPKLIYHYSLAFRLQSSQLCSPLPSMLQSVFFYKHSHDDDNDNLLPPGGLFIRDQSWGIGVSDLAGSRVPRGGRLVGI